MTTSIPPQAEDRSSARRYWRSTEHLANDPAFQEAAMREFPEGVSEAPDEVSRRGFLGVIAASVALAGFASCRKPKERIMAFARRPEDFLPGEPNVYASTLDFGGQGIGVLVRSHDGRPTKIEGNEAHPASLGGSSAQMQGDLLNLYDPARAKEVHHAGAEKAADGHAEGDHGDDHGHDAGHHHDGWTDFRAWWTTRAGELGNGRGLSVLLAPSSSPTQNDMVARLRKKFPQAKVHHWTPGHRDSELLGSRMAFGRALRPVYDLTQADVVVTLDADILGSGADHVRNARDFGTRRKVRDTNPKLSRLYAVEATYSVTGGAADHRFRLRNQEIPQAAFALAAALGLQSGGPLGEALKAHREHNFKTGSGSDWIAAVAKDLQSARGRCVVAAGPDQPPVVHAIAHAINANLGAIGTAVRLQPAQPGVDQPCGESITALATDLDSGSVNTLVCIGTNPAYDAPGDLQFAEKMGKAQHVVHAGLHHDETGQKAEWCLPLAHSLESWGDLKAHDGTVSFVQPLIQPLYPDARTASETLAELCMDGTKDDEGHFHGHSSFELVQRYWRESGNVSGNFTRWWERALHEGLVPNSAEAPVSAPAVAFGEIAKAITATPAASAGSASNLEVSVRPCPTVGDGRYSNNPWMQELPDPLTKLVWDNAVLLGPATARELGVENGQNVSVQHDGVTVTGPAYVLPGHAEWSTTIGMGYGRRLGADATVAKGAGFDAMPLRHSKAMGFLTGAKIARASGSVDLTSTQNQGTMAGRPVVREATVEEYKETPTFPLDEDPLYNLAAIQMGKEASQEKVEEQANSLNKPLWEERGYMEEPDESLPPRQRVSNLQWGMSIDLSACTGCNACVAACVAENNIPAVGKVQIAKGRLMHWIRADRYFASTEADNEQAQDDPQVVHMPVPCMQCENAPCEAVCPVAATMHSPEGLNDMVYNRCIGTRYCANNCPYKVRRFNWLDWHGDVPAQKRMAHNPDVTVRSRGVMEKCTYCVQRINRGRIQAKLDKREMQDGDIVTACQQACPTQAIVFGNVKDPNSEVSKHKQQPHDYGLLAEYNTRPRTTYLGRVRNPNPELV